MKRTISITELRQSGVESWSVKDNSRETWLDVQTRALFQAANRIFSAAQAAARQKGIKYECL